MVHLNLINYSKEHNMNSVLEVDDKELTELIKKLPQFGEIGSQEVVDIFLDNFPNFKVHNKILYYYRDGCYISFESKAQTMMFLRNVITHLKKGKRALASSIKDVFDEIISFEYSFRKWAKDETVLNLNNCVVVFGTEGVKIKKHNPEYFFSYKLPYDYDEKADCPIFSKFLNDTFNKDENTINRLQEYLGYIFMKNSVLNLEKYAIFYGAGANGKSVLVHVAINLIGENNTSFVELKNFSKENNLLQMDGKILNIGSDLSNKSFDSDVLKKIVSGEKVEVKKLYSDVTIMNNPPKMIFASNQLPDSNGDFSYGLLRRTDIYPFNNIIPEKKRDKHLIDKLKNELSGILNFVIDGYYFLLEQQEFTESELINEANKQYELQLNSLQYFLSEHIVEVSDSLKTTNQELYEIYQKWCRKSGVRATTKNKLISYIRSLNKYKEFKSNTIKGFRFKLHFPMKEIKIRKEPSEMTDEELFEDDDIFYEIA